MMLYCDVQYIHSKMAFNHKQNATLFFKSCVSNMLLAYDQSLSSIGKQTTLFNEANKASGTH